MGFSLKRALTPPKAVRKAFTAATSVVAGVTLGAGIGLAVNKGGLLGGLTQAGKSAAAGLSIFGGGAAVSGALGGILGGGAKKVGDLITQAKPIFQAVKNVEAGLGGLKAGLEGASVGAYESAAGQSPWMKYLAIAAGLAMIFWVGRKGPHGPAKRRSASKRKKHVAVKAAPISKPKPRKKARKTTRKKSKRR